MALLTMALSVDVLQKEAHIREEKQRNKYAAMSQQLLAFGVLLDAVYVDLRPQPRDYDDRRDLIRIFNIIAKEVFEYSVEAPVVEAFGSFTMDLFSAKSDLDLSINFLNRKFDLNRDRTVQTLKKFVRKFQRLQNSGFVRGVHAIVTARVPVLKVVDQGTDIECDISVENWDGIAKSKIIYLIGSIDKRFGKLSFLMKAWAKAQNINSAKDQTLNSLSIILLVAFHLQTRNPRILPPFSALFADGHEPEAVERSMWKFSNYGIRNNESVAELFVSLLYKLLSVEKLWDKGLCASTLQGCWISRAWSSGPKAGRINIEDFANPSQNVARAVGAVEFDTIYNRIKLSVQHIVRFVNNQIGWNTLREFLFVGEDIPASASRKRKAPAGKRKGQFGKRSKNKKKRVH